MIYFVVKKTLLVYLTSFQAEKKTIVYSWYIYIDWYLIDLEFILLELSILNTQYSIVMGFFMLWCNRLPYERNYFLRLDFFKVKFSLFSMTYSQQQKSYLNDYLNEAITDIWCNCLSQFCYSIKWIHSLLKKKNEIMTSFFLIKMI